jgi:hypothetical protein
VANEPLDLAALVARLRTAGLRTDIRQYLAAHELLLALAGQRHDLQDDNEALASHLGPIFCGSPEEQQLFRHEFMAWRGAPRATAAPAAQPIKKKDRRHSWIVAICATATLAGTAGLLWWKLHPEPPPPVPSEPGPVEPAPGPTAAPTIKSSFMVSAATVVAKDDVQVATSEEVSVPWLTIVAGGLGAALLVFLFLWRRNKARRDHVLSRMTPDPDTRRIELKPPPPTVTNIRTVALRRISAGLRRTRANEVFDLSVTATVNATANAGGFVVPVFAPRVAIPEYLVLIDRRSESDHSAQLVYGWVTQLCDQGVAADCYEFDSDPRVCREFGTQRSHRLPALLARHHRATVLLFAESDVCIDPITNRPQEWMRWFNSLPNRVFLTMAPPYRWAANEQRLTEAGFVLVPASPTGLQIAAAMDRNSLEAIGTGARYAREFPRMITQDTLRWLDRNPPPDATVGRLLRALHEFLGPDGYSWLCACAIYPQISWPITLALLDTLLPSGSDLPARRAIDEQLPSIARLPWFRYGYMPDWLRKLLIAQLEPEKEASIRARLEQLVCGLLGSQETTEAAKRETDASHLGIRIRAKALDVARAAPPSSPLQDEVFLDFLAGAAPDPLSLRLSSLPHIGTPRDRNLATRLRESWRGLSLRHPLSMRLAISLLLALPVAAILWATLRKVPTPVIVPDSDLTYFLSSSDLRTSQSTVAIAPNGQFMLLASPEAGKFVEIRDMVRNQVHARIPTVAQPFLLAISPRSDRIAVFDEDSNVYLSDWDGNVEQVTRPGKPPATARARDLGDRLLFNYDTSFLLHYNRESMTVFDTATRRLLATSSNGAQAAAFHGEFADTIMAFSDRTMRSLNARTLEPILEPAPYSADSVEFSYIGGDYVGAVIDPQYGSTQLHFRPIGGDGKIRAETTLATGVMPSGFVWSGDRNLVAYEEARGATTVFNISFKQPLITTQSGIPASNRLYTIRFTRSDRRRPNYTYYEIAERYIEIVPAAEAPPTEPPEPATPRQQPTPSTPPRTATPAAPTAAEIAKANEAVLARLDREARSQARMLIDLAREERITVQLRSPIRSIRHRSDISQKLDGAGRAFDVAVLMPNNTWSTTDFSSLTAVAQIAYKLGFEWSGDWGYKQFSHFELPIDVGAQATSADGPAQATQAPQPLRLQRSEFEYSGAGNAETGENWSATITRATDGMRIGRFEIEFYSNSLNEDGSIGRLDFEARGAPEKESVEDASDVYPSLYRSTMSLSASEFASQKVATKSIDSGILQFTLTIVNAELRTSGKEPGFDRKSLRIRVDVKPLVEFYDRKMAPAKAD